MRPTNDKYSQGSSTPWPHGQQQSPGGPQQPPAAKTPPVPSGQLPHNDQPMATSGPQTPPIQPQPQSHKYPTPSQFSPSGTAPLASEPAPRNQQLVTLEKEYQSVIRGFEIKLKNVSQEYRRCKLEMEVKIKQLYKEKVYWCNIASNFIEKQKKYMGECNMYNNYTSPNLSLADYPKSQSCSTNTSTTSSRNAKEEYQLESELAKLRGKVEEIERENQGMCREKLELFREYERMRNENNGYKAKLGHCEKYIQELQAQVDKYKAESARIQQKVSLSASSSSSSSNSSSNQKKPRTQILKSPPHSPQQAQLPGPHRALFPSAHDFESLKQTSQKYRILLTNLNEQVLEQKLRKLNEKYQKNYGHSFASNYGTVSVSRGGVYPVNVISDLSSRSRRGSQVNL